MITLFGEGRGFRVVWLLEEMGLPYRLRKVDLISDVTQDAEFMAVNPCGFIPALVDGDVTMVESVAIVEYLIAKYGPTPLAPAPSDPGFGLYQQFLHLSEAGLVMPLYMSVITKNIAPEADRDNWTAREGGRIFKNRLQLVTQQLTRAPYMAGDTFTAADITMTYALIFAHKNMGLTLGPAEQAYVARTKARAGFQRALAVCHDTRNWWASRPD